MEDIQPVVLSCSKCGGMQLIADANAVWNSLSNSWQLDGVHDSIFCNGCDSETRDVIKRAVFDNWPDAKRFAINETCPWGMLGLRAPNILHRSQSLFAITSQLGCNRTLLSSKMGPSNE